MQRKNSEPMVLASQPRSFVMSYRGLGRPAAAHHYHRQRSKQRSSNNSERDPPDQLRNECEQEDVRSFDSPGCAAL
jgi:hypothetical protein